MVPVARFSSPGTGSAMGGLWKRPLRATLAEGQHSALLGGKVQSCDLSCGFCFLIHALGWRAGVFLFLFSFFFCPYVWAFTSPPHEAHFQLIHPPTEGLFSQGDGMLVVFLLFTSRVSVYCSGCIIVIYIYLYMSVCINRMTCPDKCWTLIGCGLGALEVEICCFSFSI